jgi:hypothetical protein
MLIDRALQNQILERLSNSYPMPEDMQKWTAEEPKLTANLHYLHEYRLIDGVVTQSFGGGKAFINARITAAGLDFLAADGGLSAILGVVTIKLHEDTLLRLIEAKVMASNMSPADKATFMDSIRALPGESIKHLTEKLIDAGLENWQVAFDAIQTFLSSPPQLGL